MENTRREFVVIGALVPFALDAARLGHFSEDQARWIEAMMAQIIPTDQDAGAREAGCIYYLDRQLGGALKRFAPAYAKGLAEIQKQWPKFLELGSGEQIEALKAVESTAFFQMLVDHTMQGFYGSPEHGGNLGQASWKMMRIEKHMGEGHWHGA
jgi:gluconate 2-dehydrogenase gamma chain